MWSDLFAKPCLGLCPSMAISDTKQHGLWNTHHKHSFRPLRAWSTQKDTLLCKTSSWGRHAAWSATWHCGTQNGLRVTARVVWGRGRTHRLTDRCVCITLQGGAVHICEQIYSMCMPKAALSANYWKQYQVWEMCFSNEGWQQQEI